MGTYAYRSTTDKLNDAFQHIERSGDRVLDWIHTGGRDWVVIARSGEANPDLKVNIVGPTAEQMRKVREVGSEAGKALAADLEGKSKRRAG